MKKAHGRELSDRELYDMYDASLHPREERLSLNLLDRADADVYLDAVRRAVRESLAEANLEGHDPLLRDGFVYNMILQHEAQHNETMLQTFGLMKGRNYRPESLVDLPEGSTDGTSTEMVRVPGGEFVMGTWGDEEPVRDRANLDGLRVRPAPVGAYPEGASTYGSLGMIGDVWEWTSSDFYAYPGFEAYPYREYSEVFFGPDYKVLRGGSWATRPIAIRNTFRNWDYPIRRQLFVGFRCAKDA